MSNMASDVKAGFSSKVEYRAAIWYLHLTHSHTMTPFDAPGKQAL